jgi:hypothetical protein
MYTFPRERPLFANCNNERGFGMAETGNIIHSCDDGRASHLKEHKRRRERFIEQRRILLLLESP